MDAQATVYVFEHSSSIMSAFDSDSLRRDFESKEEAEKFSSLMVKNYRFDTLVWNHAEEASNE